MMGYLTVGAGACGVMSSERRQCTGADPSTTQQECAALDCCWDDTQADGVPACYGQF